MVTNNPQIVTDRVGKLPAKCENKIRKIIEFRGEKPAFHAKMALKVPFPVLVMLMMICAVAYSSTKHVPTKLTFDFQKFTKSRHSRHEKHPF